jgi:hypothetical protein
MAKKRRGMVIKNTDDRSVEIELATRMLVLHPGEEKVITADEVRDARLRASLQVRDVSIVRPATDEEEMAFRESETETETEDENR